LISSVVASVGLAVGFGALGVWLADELPL
jgi:hypothetical protein